MILYITSGFTYTAEDEDLIGLQFRDVIRRESRALDSVILSHSSANLAKENGPPMKGGPHIENALRMA